MLNKNLKIKDLTGAGDLFAAGFLHGHVNKLSLEESLKKELSYPQKLFNKSGQDYNCINSILNIYFFFFLLKLPFPFLGLTTLVLYFVCH